MTDYTATELMAAKIAILRDRLPDLIAGQHGPEMLGSIVEALTCDAIPSGVYSCVRVSDAAKIIDAARAWVLDGLQAIDDDAAIERIETDRAAQAGPSLGVVDRIAERLP